MSDGTGNGAYPATLEQRVHALEEERAADRRHIGNLEGRWGQLLTATIQTQASARKAAAAANSAREAVWELKSRVDTFETAVVSKLDELIGAVRELATSKAGG